MIKDFAIKAIALYGFHPGYSSQGTCQARSNSITITLLQSGQSVDYPLQSFARFHTLGQRTGHRVSL